jgi:hypothetical protein
LQQLRQRFCQQLETGWAVVQDCASRPYFTTFTAGEHD